MRKRKISKAERRHQDYVRREGLKVGKVYEARLIKARRTEVKRVLDIARDFDSPEDVASVIQRIDETKYIQPWLEGLYKTAGMPCAERVAKQLREKKAESFSESDVWYNTLVLFARKRAGALIQSVSDTLKKSLVAKLRDLMESDVGMSIEELTRALYASYKKDIEKWQARRIAQTETMISMSRAGQAAADTLDIAYTKTWAVSGLDNTRDTHLAMDGITVDQHEYFELAGGKLLYPHDLSMNPDPSEIINCACDVIRDPK